VPDLPNTTIEYLTNERFIAVDQDALTLQATLVSRTNQTFDVLTKSLSNGDRAVAILNNGSAAASHSVPVSRIGWTMAQGCNLTATDLWSGNTSTINACASGAALTAQIDTHGVAAWRIAPESKTAWTSTGLIFNAENLDCLTTSNSSVVFAVCDASDSQVWSVGQNASTIMNTATKQCLSYANSTLAMTTCSTGNATEFFYDISGNIKNPASGYQCLTEGDNGDASLQECQYLIDAQVFEIPSGWQL